MSYSYDPLSPDLLAAIKLAAGRGRDLEISLPDSLRLGHDRCHGSNCWDYWIGDRYKRTEVTKGLAWSTAGYKKLSSRWSKGAACELGAGTNLSNLDHILLRSASGPKRPLRPVT